MVIIRIRFKINWFRWGLRWFMVIKHIKLGLRLELKKHINIKLELKNIKLELRYIKELKHIKLERMINQHKEHNST